MQGENIIFGKNICVQLNTNVWNSTQIVFNGLSYCLLTLSVGNFPHALLKYLIPTIHLAIMILIPNPDFIFQPMTL